MKSIEIHINDHTLETRHCLTDSSTTQLHAGFTSDDIDVGWRKFVLLNSLVGSDDEIAAAKKRAVDGTRSYWEALVSDSAVRVVHEGRFYVVFDPESMANLGSALHRVDWMDSARGVSECQLIFLGSIPNWIRDRLPDNVNSLECLE